MTTPLDIARDYIARGWSPVPIPVRGKAPTIDGWQKLRITAETAPRHFNNEPQNIGIVLGAASGNLVDVDLDTPEALAVAPFFLPETDAVFGRKSSRGAHRLYVLNDGGVPGTRGFNNPLVKDDEKARIVELRGTGGQTVFPGSTHRDTGESIEWERAGAPARVAYGGLLRAVQRVAAIALIATHWDPGTRDDLCAATVGVLLRAGWSDPEIQNALLAVAAAADDEKIDSRMEKIERLRETLRAGSPVYGLPKLGELTDVKVANNVRKWLELQEEVDPVPLPFAPVPEEWLTGAPPPLTYTLRPLLPARTVALLVAEGGAGKTTFALRVALAVATGRPLFGMEVIAGRVCYLAMEDQADSLRRRVHLIFSREQERMRRDGRSPAELDEYLRACRENLILVAGAGYQLHLVTMNAGQVTQAPAVSALIEKLPRPLELLVLDPLSRLNGAEENNNAVGTAMINAAERIVREARCSVIIPHHTGKAASKDRDAGQYSARGASAFVDAARSCVRLLAVTDMKGFENVPSEVIARGDLIQVLHTKCNEGPKAKTFYLRRQELDFDLFVPERMSVQRVQDRIMSALFGWYCQNAQQPFSQNRVSSKDALPEIFGTQKPSRDQVRDAYARAVEAGDLVPSGQTAPNSKVPLMRFRPDYADPEGM